MRQGYRHSEQPGDVPVQGIEQSVTCAEIQRSVERQQNRSAKRSVAPLRAAPHRPRQEQRSIAAVARERAPQRPELAQSHIGQPETREATAGAIHVHPRRWATPSPHAAAARRGAKAISSGPAVLATATPASTCAAAATACIRPARNIPYSARREQRESEPLPAAAAPASSRGSTRPGQCQRLQPAPAAGQPHVAPADERMA